MWMYWIGRRVPCVLASSLLGRVAVGVLVSGELDELLEKSWLDELFELLAGALYKFELLVVWSRFCDLDDLRAW